MASVSSRRFFFAGACSVQRPCCYLGAALSLRRLCVVSSSQAHKREREDFLLLVIILLLLLLLGAKLTWWPPAGRNWKHAAGTTKATTTICIRPLFVPEMKPEILKAKAQSWPLKNLLSSLCSTAHFGLGEISRPICCRCRC